MLLGQLRTPVKSMDSLMIFLHGCYEFISGVCLQNSESQSFYISHQIKFYSYPTCVDFQIYHLWNPWYKRWSILYYQLSNWTRICSLVKGQVDHDSRAVWILKVNSIDRFLVLQLLSTVQSEICLVPKIKGSAFQLLMPK